MKFFAISGACISFLAVVTLSAQAPKSQWDGIYTAQQAKRGQVLYEQKTCINCHAKNLYGFLPDVRLGGPLVDSLSDTSFSDRWDGATFGDLFEKIRNTQPPTEPGTLTDQEAADLLSYILQTGRYPAGKTELSTNIEELTSIKFLAKKP
jgi:mono/diheme cytochrome c family protein